MALKRPQINAIQKPKIASKTLKKTQKNILKPEWIFGRGCMLYRKSCLLC